MLRKIVLLAVLEVLLMPISATADIYLCLQEDGVKAAQDFPCEDSRYGQSMTKKEPVAVENEPIQKQPSLANNDLYRFVQMACPAFIEKLAEWDFEWTNGMFDFRFKPTPMATSRSDVVAFYGDSLRMQNGFGAWSNMIYYCEINTITGKLVDVRVVKGRL